jgi:capsular polysaccharide export protein
MAKRGFRLFRDKRILLLQGPVGPFFRRLSVDFTTAGSHVFKINFNGGDWLFYPSGATAYRGTFEEWPAFLENFLTENGIDMVMLFGDCRPLHRKAHEICQQRGIEVGVFEEGYLRPDFISFERYGVNGNSRLPRNPEFYRRRVYAKTEETHSVGNPFWYAMTWAMLYNTASRIGSPCFRHYRHHRTLTVCEGLLWLRAFWRKIYYSDKERGIQEILETRLSHRYFLVPLQVHNDAQIREHSDFKTVIEFIVHVIESFAETAPDDVHLVFKHHPLDRGYSDYTVLITKLVRERNLTGRVFYIHDQHLPSLIRHTKGVVTINSTVGLSALHHGVPVKVCGRAIYDVEGLIFPGTLADFWSNPKPGDRRLYMRFRNFLIAHTQLNGSFYRRLPVPESCVGVLWMSRRLAAKWQAKSTASV